MDNLNVPHLIDPLGQAIPLATPVTLLGRGAECHVVIADRRASRRHAEIVCGDDPSPNPIASAGFVLRDLDSTNGVWFNGQRLSQMARLHDGDVIEIAGAAFTFRDPDATLQTTHFPKLVMDEATGDVWVDRCPVQLSAKQRGLLTLLWRRRGQVCAKDEIAAAVWPECRGDIYDYQIESLIKRLRVKLEPDAAEPFLIVNVPGRGYRLAV
ncbi:MAG: FHA domain-containing protein [Chloroflexi bacterium]|nr:FHA domain-containing protein [Chloroflexota bacterium]